MSDTIGHYDHIVEKRQAVTRGLSPSALHRHFPRLYAKPIPREATVVVDPTPPLRAEIAALKARNATLEQENARLNILVSELSKPLAKRRPVAPEAIMEAFCNAMAASNRLIGGQPWSVEDLKGVTRTVPYARPRQVCMWLVRRIAPQVSVAAIARAFGGKDHTTAIHACKRAPDIMSEDPGLRQVAVSVLRTFGARDEVEPTP